MNALSASENRRLNSKKFQESCITVLPLKWAFVSLGYRQIADLTTFGDRLLMFWGGGGGAFDRLRPTRAGVAVLSGEF